MNPRTFAENLIYRFKTAAWLVLAAPWVFVIAIIETRGEIDEFQDIQTEHRGYAGAVRG